MGKQGLQALRVRGPLPPPPAHDAAEHHRDAPAIAEHVAPLRGQIEELVHAQEHEVVPGMHHEGPLANRGGSDGDPGHRVLPVGDVEDALRAEAPEGVGGRVEDPLEVVDTDPGDEDAGIRLHALHGGLADRLPVGESPHGRPQYVPSVRSSTAGKGAVLASATAASISLWLSRSKAISAARSARRST